MILTAQFQKYVTNESADKVKKKKSEKINRLTPQINDACLG